TPDGPRRARRPAPAAPPRSPLKPPVSTVEGPPVFTAHGSASASGARTAVCPAPVRRALLLAALLGAVLCALWLAGAAPAGAAEGPGAGIEVPTGPLDPHRAAVADLGRPLADTVATVGTVGTAGTGVDSARRALEEQPLAPQAPAGPQEVA